MSFWFADFLVVGLNEFPTSLVVWFLYMVQVRTLDVITVCYNSLEPLKLTLKSIQAYAEDLQVRWIVVDGCSTDGSVELVRYSGVTDVVHVVEADAGIYDAMNKGLALVASDYFMLLNAGDLLMKGEMSLVHDKVNCFVSAWHDRMGTSSGVRRNYLLPWLGIMPNHQGMVFPKRYAAVKYDQSLSVSADLGVKLLAWKNGDIVMRSDVLVSSLEGGVSQVGLSLSDYFLRIKENYLASSILHPLIALGVTLSTAVRGLRRLRIW